MNDFRRAVPYSILSADRIESFPVRDRLQLMDDLWNSLFFGGGRNAGDLWFPLRTAIAREFMRRFPDDIEEVWQPDD